MTKGIRMITDEGNSPSQSSKIQEILKRVESNQLLTAEEFEETINVLETFECWVAYFKILESRIADPAQRNINHYVRLARTHYRYLDNIGKAAEICSNLTIDLKVSFLVLQHEVISRILNHEDFAAEAMILNAASHHFKDSTDQVKCLERLSNLYEKKTHNETLLAKTYERLIEADPKNVKALRYFKLVFTQSGEWEEVVLILKTLLTSVSYPQERYRVALELAAIYLYQLDQPKEAIEIVEGHCNESPIDTSTVLYDGYQRLSQWEGCLRVLRQCLLTVDDDIGRSIIRFKMGQIFEQNGDLAQAVDNFQRSFMLWPALLDAAEGVIEIGVKLKDWGLVQKYLELLKDATSDKVLKSQITQVLRRLSDGLSHGYS